MKYGIVNLSSIQKASFRIDPSLHLSEGVKVRNSINNIRYGSKPLSTITSNIFLGNIFTRTFVKSKEFGKTYLSASDTVLANIETGRFLSNAQSKNLSYLILEKDWILCTCSGTLGNVTYTNKHFCDKIATHDLIRIIPDDKSCKKGCLYAFLSSKYGYYQITQSQFGGVVKHINADQAGNIVVPCFPQDFQDNIENFIVTSSRLREESIESLNSAIAIFESKIGPSKVNLGYNSKRISSQSILNRFCRFDSQFQIGKSEITKYNKSEKIGNIASKIFVGNRGKRNYVANGIPFLSSSDMMLANPLHSPKHISKNSPGLSDMIVNEGNILISRSGTVGNTIIVGKELSGTAVSEHAMKLIINKSKIAPEYVFAYFMTEHGRSALQILPYGSVIVTLGEDFLADVDLPIIDKESYDKVVFLVKDYIEKNDKAISFENKAISLVEQEIEKWNN